MRWCRSRPQGAAQATLDAAVLGDVLAGAMRAEIPDAALDRYARRRLWIATSVQASSARAGKDHHLPDEPEAQARNTRMAACAAVRSLAQMTTGLDHHPDFGCEAASSGHRWPAGPLIRDR